MPLSFGNIEVIRLAANERFGMNEEVIWIIWKSINFLDMSSWKKIDGKTYTINVIRGNVSTVGNGGDVY